VPVFGHRQDKTVIGRLNLFPDNLQFLFTLPVIQGIEVAERMGVNGFAPDAHNIGQGFFPVEKDAVNPN